MLVHFGEKTLFVAPMRIIENASLRSYNTFGVAIRASYLAFLEKPEDVVTLVADSRFAEIPKLIIGGGSNLLLRGDYPGLVALVRFRGIDVIAQDGDDVYVRAAAGEDWHHFVQDTIARGLIGLENLSLIPGTVGAAPIQNIGAYGVELSERFESLEAISLSDGRLRTFNKRACGFGYRSSVFKTAVCGQQVITSVTVKLSHKAPFVLNYGGVQEELAQYRTGALTAHRVSDAICRIRRRKLPNPVQLGNVGSFFKNPIINQVHLEQLRREFPQLPFFPLPDGRFKISAAWLIDQCGWKGYRYGDTGVYDKHALVLVNYGSATGDEIWRLAEAIMASVHKRFQVALEPEPRIL